MTGIAIEPDGLMHLHTDPDVFWTTANAGEAVHGVVTPLGWSVWGPSIELGIRDTFARMGALPRREVAVPSDPSARVVSVFYGRAALSVSFLARMGDRLPGSSGEAIARQMFGEVPEEMAFAPTHRRLPVIAGKLPHALAMIRRQVAAGTAPTAAWWRDWISRMPSLDVEGAAAAIDDARRRQIALTKLQARAVFVGVQTSYDQLLALIERSGIDRESANALMAGQGSHAETEIIADIWRYSRGRMTMEEFLARHGYHGAGEGQLLNRMWREDPRPIEQLAAQYAGKQESEHPAKLAERRQREREAAERRLLASLPASRRPAAKLILKLAVERIPLRGVAKETLIMALDVTRAAARRTGTLLAQRGVLAEPDDAFYFTADELIAGLPDDAKELAARRRALRDELETVTVPQHFRGMPEPVAVGGRSQSDARTVEGAAGSGGIAEGVVRLVHDPAFEEIEPGEILVCPTTDPSWASVLFIAGALVVDIGGPLSHAAVVAREIGIPCVIGTNDATKVLRTGDRVRVDGDSGTVEILSREPAPP